ncbi:MAG: NAD(P)/FAD-dependent oxidoreductase [Flavobacteriaceae bacterium]
MNSQDFDVIIVGGGASGFFAAINLAKKRPDLKVLILEKTKNFLGKVKISGGGRCNVTHAEFLPQELTKKYPRGEKELRGPFHRFMTGDMMAWLEEHGVALKIEEDGRIFPTSDDSQTIIDCFLNEAEKHEVQFKTSQVVKGIEQTNEVWQLKTSQQNFTTKHLIIASGSSQQMWKQLQSIGHQVVKPVPSLFTFHIQDDLLQDLQGLALPTEVKVFDNKGLVLSSDGDTLITHWGLSGPAILKLSAWGARDLHDLDYKFELRVNWLASLSTEDLLALLSQSQKDMARKQMSTTSFENLPKRFWLKVLKKAKIEEAQKWADLSKQNQQDLSSILLNSRLKVTGKSTFKEEFVTAGGVELKEVDFKTFESKIHPRLYIIGETLNIDAITGGFNFQNAWTSAFHVAKAISER